MERIRQLRTSGTEHVRPETNDFTNRTEPISAVCGSLSRNDDNLGKVLKRFRYRRRERLKRIVNSFTYQEACRSFEELLIKNEIEDVTDESNEKNPLEIDGYIDASCKSDIGTDDERSEHTVVKTEAQDDTDDDDLDRLRETLGL